MTTEKKTYFGWEWSKNGKSRPGLFLLSLFGFVLIFINQTIFAQVSQPQIPQPAFLQPDEVSREVINGTIYLAYETPKEQPPTVINGKTYSSKEKISKNSTAKFYFTDGHGKVISAFNVYPSASVLGASMVFRHSKKYLMICCSYVDGQKDFVDTYLLNNSGQILWHIPRKDLVGLMGDIFPSDENDTVMMVDIWKGFLKIYDVNGIEMVEKYFTDQSDKKFPDLATENMEDIDFRGGVEASESGEYVAVSRASTELKDFQNELILLDSKGKVVFQNRAPQSKVGGPMKILEDLKMILVSGDINGKLTDRHFRSHEMYFGIDFTGKELWELDGQKYFIYRGDLNGSMVKLENVEKDMDSSGKYSRGNKFVPSGRTLDLKTGEVK